LRHVVKKWLSEVLEMLMMQPELQVEVTMVENDRHWWWLLLTVPSEMPGMMMMEDEAR